MLELRLNIKHANPEIYRIVRVDDQLNLQLIHEVIQASFCWSNIHSHFFRTSEQGIIKNEEDFSISEALGKWDKITYVYDLADFWTIEITLENKSPEPYKRKPVCLKGQGKSPPEDSGGIINYCEVLELYSNHQAGKRKYPLIADWLGENFNPFDFDCDLVNENLKNLVL